MIFCFTLKLLSNKLIVVSLKTILFLYKIIDTQIQIYTSTVFVVFSLCLLKQMLYFIFCLLQCCNCVITSEIKIEIF